MEQKRKIILSEYPIQQYFIQSIPDKIEAKIAYFNGLFDYRNKKFQLHCQLKKNRLLFLAKAKLQGYISIIDLYPYDLSKIEEGIIQIYEQEIEIYPQYALQKILNGKKYKNLFDSKKMIGIFVIEYQIASKTLQEILEEFKKGVTLQKNFLLQLIKNVMFSLCCYHAHHIIINNFTFKNILVNSHNHSIFILPTKQSISISSNSNIYKSQINDHNDQIYNIKSLIKSDIYNLAKLFLQIFKEVKCNPEKKLYLRQSITIQKIKEEQFQTISDILSLMLAPVQDNRLSSFELLLYLGKIDWIKKLIQIPYQKYFEKKIVKISTSDTYVKIKYIQVPIEIEAEIQEQLFKKSDIIGKQLVGNITITLKNGIIYNEGKKIYEGQFQKNKPSGKCKMILMDKWTYEGEYRNFEFHGQGMISFDSQIISKGQFFHNLLLQKIQTQILLTVGIQYFVQQNAQDYKIYCKYINSSHFKINFTKISNQSMIFSILRYFKIKEHIKQIKLQQDLFNNIFSFSFIDIIEIKLLDDQIGRIGCPKGIGRKVLLHLLSEKLQKIDLSGCQKLKLEQFKTILNLNFKFENLKEIDLSNTHINDQIFINFIDDRKNLQKINISCTKITDQGLINLMYSKIIKIKQLKINYLKIQNLSIVQRIILSQKCKFLELIQIQGLSIHNNNLQKFNNLKQNHLQQINIGKCNFLTDKGLQDFFMTYNWSQLKKLSLAHNNINNKIIQVICCVKNKANFKYINLSGCLNIKGSSLKQLIKNEKLKNLEQLDVSSTNFNDDCLNQYIQEANIVNLKKLNISSCFSITEKCIIQFFSNYSPLNLESLNISKLKFRSNIFLKLSRTRFVKLKELYCIFIEKEDLQLLSGFQYLEQLILESSPLCKSNHIQHFKWIYKNSQLKNLSLWCEKQLMMELIDQFSDHMILKFKSMEQHGDELNLEKKENNNKEIISEQTQDLINLLKSPIFQKVKVLDLSNQFKIDENKISRIFDTPYAKNIIYIDISSSCFGTKFIDSIFNNNLVHPNHRFRLKRLNISHIKDNIDQGFAKVIKSGILDQIEVLDLSWTFIHNSTLQCLAKQEITSLKQLNLNNMSYITDQGFQALINSKTIAQVMYLDLRYTQITNKTLENLSRSKFIRKLSYLFLGSCENISMMGIKILLKSEIIRSIKVLDLGWTKVDNTLFQILSKNQFINFKKLILTGLQNCWDYFGDYINSQSFEQLELIDISFTNIKDKNLVNYLTCKNNKLISVNLKNSLVSKGFSEKLQKMVSSRLSKKVKQQCNMFW